MDPDIVQYHPNVKPLHRLSELSHRLPALSGAVEGEVKQHGLGLHIVNDGYGFRDVIKLGRSQLVRMMLRLHLVRSRALEPPMPNMGPVTTGP